MAIRNFSSTLGALSLIAVVVLAGCQTATQSSTPPRFTGVEVNPPSATPAPIAPANPSEVPVMPIQEGHNHKVAVILGPGGAKALAHVGVLRAFQQQRIPIERVIGLEWGALVGALFASKGQAHDVEWKLYKMEQRNLPRPKGFFAKRVGDDPVSVMDDFLQDAFGSEQMSEAKIRFSCPSRSIWSGVVSWQNRGLMKDAMKHCLPFPPVFKAQGTFLAGASQASEAIEQLRSEGFDVIILVNVLGSAMPVDQDSLLDNLNYVILWQEIKRELNEAAKLGVEVVNVDTSAAPIVQFDAKKDLISAGENAGQKAAGLLISKYGF